MGHGSKMNWHRQLLCHLTAYIVGKYHWPLRERITRLVSLEGSLRDSSEPWAAGKLGELLNVLTHELHLHVVREEQILFPYIGLLEETAAKQRTTVPFFGSVARLCDLLRSDGVGTCELLDRLLHLLGKHGREQDHELLRRLGGELKSLRSELVQHLRLEEEVLFPRSVALDQSVHGTPGRATGHPASVTPIADKTQRLALVE